MIIIWPQVKQGFPITHLGHLISLVNININSASVLWWSSNLLPKCLEWNKTAYGVKQNQATNSKQVKVHFQHLYLS